MNVFGTWKLKVFPRLHVTMGAILLVVVACAFAGIGATQVTDDQAPACSNLPSFSALKNAIAAATAAETSGLNNQMRATLVNCEGVVYAVASPAATLGPRRADSTATLDNDAT